MIVTNALSEGTSQIKVKNEGHWEFQTAAIIASCKTPRNSARRHDDSAADDTGDRISGLDRSFPLLAQLRQQVEHSLRDFQLRGLGNLADFLPRNDGDSVAFRIKAQAFPRDVIHDDRIQVLRDQLLPRILEHVLGLGSEANNYL